MHGSRIIAAAACSAIANGTFCSAASLWYWRRRAICGSTLEVPAWCEAPVRSATFCSIERRHLEQSSASPPLEGLSNARLRRVSSGPAGGLLVWGSSPAWHTAAEGQGRRPRRRSTPP